MISLIVAMSENRAIGLRGSLPWHLPGDLAHFKKTTMGRPVIMGRKTYASLKGPLPKRPNIVITRNRSYMAMGAAVAHDLDDAIVRAKALAGGPADDGEIFILGGAEVYRQALPIADRLYITHVHADVEGDTFFPEYDESQWRVIEEERHKADERNAYVFTIRTYERR
jgi:dihydrofolate reductase